MSRFLLVVLVLVLAACGEDDATPAVVPEPPPAVPKSPPAVPKSPPVAKTPAVPTKRDPLVLRAAAVEPPLEFQLVVDGTSHAVALDKAFTVPIGGKDAHMKLTVDPNRVFYNVKGIRFPYPRNFAYEYDASSPAVRIWTFDGNDCVIMLFEFLQSEGGPSGMLDLLLRNMTNRWGRRNVRVTNGEMTLGGRKVKSKMMRVSVAGEQITQNLATFEGNGKVYGLIVQDSLDDDNNESEETAGVRKQLAASFTFPK